MKLNENRIRDLAYQIWESEGRPHGQAQRHWETACKLAAENSSSSQSRQVSASIPDAQTPVANQQQAEAKSGKPVRKPKTHSSPQMN